MSDQNRQQPNQQNTKPKQGQRGQQGSGKNQPERMHANALSHRRTAVRAARANRTGETPINAGSLFARAVWSI